MTTYMVTGYRTTGKDTLYQVLTGQISSPCNVKIYKTPWKTPRWPGSELTRIAFADILKETVASRLGIDLSTVEKDTIGPNGRTFRQECIDYAKEKRNEDPDIWSRLAVDTFMKNPDIDYMVTDWRYPNEKEYLMKRGCKIVTIRVFRSEVLIPDRNDESEHSLDTILTDYLVIPESDYFEWVVVRFPQYRGFTRVM